MRLPVKAQAILSIVTTNVMAKFEKFKCGDDYSTGLCKCGDTEFSLKEKRVFCYPSPGYQCGEDEYPDRFCEKQQ